MKVFIWRGFEQSLEISFEEKVDHSGDRAGVPEARPPLLLFLPPEHGPSGRASGCPLQNGSRFSALLPALNSNDAGSPKPPEGITCMRLVLFGDLILQIKYRLLFIRNVAVKLVFFLLLLC